MNLAIFTVVISAVFSFGTAWWIQGTRIDHLKAEYTNERLAREQSIRQAAIDAQAKVAQAQDAAKAATDRARRDAASAIASGDKLRDTLAASVRAAHTDIQTCARQVDAISDVFRASTEVARRMASEADSWAVQAVTLQEAWPKCP